MSWRVASGRVGSSGSACMNLTTGFIHHFCANWWSIAKTGSLSRIEKAISASSRLTWFNAMIALGPALATFSMPSTSSR